jgi:hypothetical protein
VLAAERGGHFDQPVTAASLAAAPLRGELEDAEASLLVAADEAEQETGFAFAPVDVDGFGCP